MVRARRWSAESGERMMSKKEIGEVRRLALMSLDGSADLGS